jgi:uncharacterized lipoprotein YddW (UPF0748 family)
MKNKIIYIIIFSLVLLLSACKDNYKVKREARGVWISRFDYVTADKSIERMKSTILNNMRNVRAAKMNMIFFQVRGNADAFYKSDYEPWSALLTGELGKDPGWDPLQYAIETAHSLGLELHVWINTFPAWKAKDNLPSESYPRHVMLQHPEWIICDKNGDMMRPEEGYISLSPGNPDVQNHISKVVMDIVKKYDIDGVHFDYIRYPEETVNNGYSGDKISKERFKSVEGNPKKLEWEDWERDQINQFISNTSDLIKQSKPYLKVSAAVIGRYKQGKWNGYNSVYQDAKEWLKDGKVDFIVPMSYLKLEDFSNAMKEWKTIIDVKDIYPGLAAYKANDWGWKEIWEEVASLRDSGFQGFVFFAVNSLDKVWNEIKDVQLTNWANIPETRSKLADTPEDVESVTVERLDDDKVKISWKLPGNGSDYYFNIYRSGNGRYSSTEGNELAYVTPRGVNSVIDDAKNNYFYSVSALNRYNVEGKISKPVNIKDKQITLVGKK